MIAFLLYLPVILLGISVALLPALFAARSLTALRVMLAILCASWCLSLVLFAYWTWFFRDGLKAGFVPSEGAAAWLRFAEAFWLPFVLLLGIIGLSCLFYRVRLMRLRSQII